MNKQSLKDKAETFALEKFDYVIDIVAGTNFYEVTGSIGGDILRYRIYEDFITQK